MSQTDPARVLAAAQRHCPAMKSLLKQLVEIESPSSNLAAQQGIKELLDQQFNQLDFMTIPLAGTKHGGNFYARPRKKLKQSPVQLLIGHIDTVWPLGTLESMPYLDDGEKIKGPGVFDMKGGIAQIVTALKVLQELDYCPSVTPVIFVNSDEEVGSKESTHHIRRLAQIASRAYIMEPALGEAGALKTRRKGVGRFNVKVRGKAAHAGLDPTAGASAILELSHVIQKLFDLNDLDRGITVNVGIIDGGIRPNVVAPVSTASVDVRILNSSDIPNVEKAIQSICSSTEGVDVKINGRIGRPPLEKNKRNNRLWQYAQNLAESLGMQLTQATAGGGSDGCTTSQYTATLDGLGAVGDGAHAEHEFLYIDKTIERVALLAMLIMAPQIEEGDHDFR